ncbi:hypothetical protein AAC387_Pa02g4897 [Persea americana]
MGRKLDALLGRSFKPAKLKTLLNLAISRLAVLKNQRQVRCNHARSDVAQLLEMGHQERALLRVEHVIKEQNMFDAFVIMEGYCNLLIERVSLIENQKDCPKELREAIAGLLFACSRCGDFPELQQIREMFASRYGKDFTASAVELRNHCCVNPKIIQKMSTRQPSLESRLNVVKEIASEKGLTLDIEEPSSGITEDSNMSQKTRDKAKPNRSNAGVENLVDGGMEDDVQSITRTEPVDELSGSMKARKKYADVASAAQAAFESAAQAALAARAAIELSKSETHDSGSDDQSSHGTRGRNRYKNREDVPLRNRAGNGIAMTEEVEHFSGGSEFEKIHPILHSSSESEDEEPPLESRNIVPEKFEGKPKEKLERSASASSLDSTGTMNEAGGKTTSEQVIHFDESDEETEDWARIPSKPSDFHYSNQDQKIISQADSISMQHEEYRKMGSGLEKDGNTVEYLTEKQVHRSEMGKKPISMRTWRGFK